MTRWTRWAASWLGALALIATACGDGRNGEQASAAPARVIAPDVLPATLLGLSLQGEPIGDHLESAPAGYADAVGLFSLRREHRLMGTLQVVALDAQARVDDAEFRERMVTQIGTSAPRRVQIAGRTVWVTLGSKERTAVWFDGRMFFLLTTRPDFERPRALLRTLLDAGVTV